MSDRSDDGNDRSRRAIEARDLDPEVVDTSGDAAPPSLAAETGREASQLGSDGDDEATIEVRASAFEWWCGARCADLADWTFRAARVAAWTWYLPWLAVALAVWLWSWHACWAAPAAAAWSRTALEAIGRFWTRRAFFFTGGDVPFRPPGGINEETAARLSGGDDQRVDDEEV